MVREVKESEKKYFDKIATHPLQTWAWGEFRKSPRVDVVRLGEYKNDKLINAFQITFHKLPFPKIPFTFGYCPKSSYPSSAVLKAITIEAQKRSALMVKFEPNVLAKNHKSKITLPKGRPLFTKYSFWLDLTQSESELLNNLKSKTRYNVRLAEKKGVTVIEDNSDAGFSDYWRLTQATTTRQGFYAHNEAYHRQMWRTLNNKSGFVHLLKAVYNGKILVTWILFTLNGILYYPYGASSDENREVMASNLMMWEAIKLGKEHDCKLFDMWGSTGPNPKPNDPWLGFHRFKEGYGATLVEFVGTFDLIINPLLYWPYRLGESVRWFILRLLK